jgi:hypothetical protein
MRALGSGGPLPGEALTCLPGGGSFPRIDVEVVDAVSSEKHGRAFFRKTVAPQSELLTQLDDCFETARVRVLPAPTGAAALRLSRVSSLTCGSLVPLQVREGNMTSREIRPNARGVRLFLWKEGSAWKAFLESPSVPFAEFSCASWPLP